MPERPAIMSMLLRAVVWLVAGVGLVPAQQARFAEVRRWRWRSPDVVCGAADAAGTIAALGQRDASGSGWEVLLWDPKARGPLRTVPVNKRPIAVRFPDGAHVEVRLADTDAFFSLSHWHRFSIADGTAVGEPKLSRVEDDDVVARKRMRGPSSFGDDVEPGPEPCIMRERDVVSWWKDGVSVPVADFAVRAIELTPDGRFAVVWLPSRLVVIPVAVGEATALPLPGEEVLAIEAGTDGDELLVVTENAVRVLRAGTGREIRSVPCDAKGAVAAALAPGGGLLAVAFGAAERMLLLDVTAGRATKVNVNAWALSWAPDGRRLAGGGHGCFSIGRDGAVISQRLDQQFHEHHIQNGRANLLALDGDLDAWGLFGQTYVVTHGVPDPFAGESPPRVRIRARLTPHELIATNGMRLLACDAASWETTGEIDLRVDLGQVAVAPAARRVAVEAGPEIVVLDVSPAK